MAVVLTTVLPLKEKRTLGFVVQNPAVPMTLGATWAIARLAMAFRVHLRLRGQRLVTCSETNETARHRWQQ
jgi:hypothetical protein